jgi:tol-pal system protein YbgF
MAVAVFWGTATVAPAADERLDRLERRVAKITELTLQIDALRRDNRELRGQIERQQHVIETLQRKQRDLYQDIDQRLSQLQSSGSPNAAGAAGSDAVLDGLPGGTPLAGPERARRPASPAAADPARELVEYQAAYDLLRPEQRRYDEAIQAFRAFLQNYPNGKLADNAQYWLAEASYVTQDNAVALAEFQKVVDNYPDSTKVPGSLLKIGYLQHASGQIDAARQTLSKVVDDYPTTSAASMARQRLQRIDREAR